MSFCQEKYSRNICGYLTIMPCYVLAVQRTKRLVSREQAQGEGEQRGARQLLVGGGREMQFSLKVPRQQRKLSSLGTFGAAS